MLDDSNNVLKKGTKSTNMAVSFSSLLTGASRKLAKVAFC